MTTDWTDESSSWVGLENAPTGAFWYKNGMGAIGTWNPVESGTITLYYEGLPATQTVNGADADLGFPDDWYDTLAAMVVEQLLREVGKRTVDLKTWAFLVKEQRELAMNLKRELASNRERQNYQPGIPERLDF